MKLRICRGCKRPYIDKQGGCPRCPNVYTWDQESWSNFGCLMLMVVPVFLAVLFWLLFFLGILIR